MIIRPVTGRLPTASRGFSRGFFGGGSRTPCSAQGVHLKVYGDFEKSPLQPGTPSSTDKAECQRGRPPSIVPEVHSGRLAADVVNPPLRSVPLWGQIFWVAAVLRYVRPRWRSPDFWVIQATPFGVGLVQSGRRLWCKANRLCWAREAGWKQNHSRGNPRK